MMLDPDPTKRFTTADGFLCAPKSTEARISRRAEPVHTQLITAFNVAPPKLTRVFDVGDIVGNVRLSKRIGTGAFGVVYLGRHLTLEIDVAVKFLPPELAAQDPSYVEMF